ncbi:Trp family transcriptional regulator [Sediminispirochaeta bajacaliforniensis]|uniref:Trp family transcriptional regulator n=1 Tax=Sediminispirochaeta bajacaliforniensis TaxID=148 RepID=UPI000363BB63|nr:Trp family transcriptional regulator [Sediminispirochaeta bajacaliforniensis]
MENDEHVSEGALAELARALAKCEDPTLIRDFLLSIFTPAEADDIGKRWALVRLLDEGKTQRTIAAELGLSLCKITRGSRELKKSHSAFRAMINLADQASR